MNIQTHKIGETEIAEVISDKTVIQNTEDALDLMGDIYYQGFDKIILHLENITADFFDLKNKMAGEILQKFSNYRISLAVVGGFTGFTSNSLRDFIYESNKGRQVNFVASVDEALNALTK
ncbi:DUF4180 domain-containing protein [Algoriphagus sp. Y33]|uniref:DUF4180 domain-containing protein n=1 Tax=Algoriphagus sp. Y33 TaxID=2772483 RepID=UPI001785E038|nr:DUF4180 domain-containing protein [Algoriphagus sp. Y33]